MKGLVVILFIIYFMNAVNLGSALKCYSCDSAVNSTCKSDGKSADTIDCTQGLDECITVTADGKVKRDCGNDALCALATMVSGVTCKTCKSDLCNGSGVPSYTTPLVIFIALYASLKLLF